MDPFLAEIRMFPISFAPRGWAFCNGQLLPISQNTALFSLLGTTYGGDGKSNFALPNLQGSAPMHPGQGPGLSLHDLGETGGVASVTLIANEMPAHDHFINVSQGDGSERTPGGQLFATGSAVGMYDAGNMVQLNSQAVIAVGGAQPHNNLQPYLTLNFCIALQGIYPPRS